jgi:hypothetical protein
VTVAQVPTSAAFRVRTPADWRYLSLGEDRDAHVADFVRLAAAHLHRDNAAVHRHRMREAITALVAECENLTGAVRVHGVLMPVPSAGTESAVPATMTCATVQMPSTGLRPVEVLVGAARTDPTATAVEAGSHVALRTHEFRDVRERFVERVADGTVSAQQQARILAETPDHMYAFRVDYLTGRQNPDVWARLSLAAMVPVDDARHELARAYLELGDAVVA